MLTWNSEVEWYFGVPVAIAVVLVLAFTFYRDRVRKKSLHRREDGIYVWVEWHGEERSSLQDPSSPGGEWDSSGDGDGGGD